MSRTLTFDDLMRIRSVSHVAVSPDGKEVIAAVKSVATASTYQTNLYRWNGARPVRLTRGRFTDSQPQFDDRGTLYFASNRGKPLPGVYRLGKSGPELVFTMPEGAMGPVKVSPDGKKFAFLYRPADPSTTKEGKAKLKKDKASAPPLAFSQFPWRLDGDGEFGDRTWSLMVWQGGKATELGPRDCWAAIDFAWLPDSKGLVVAHDPRPEPFMEPDSDIIERILLTGERTEVASGNGGKTMLSVSPNGTQVAFVLDSVDQHKWGIRRQHLGVTELATGKCRMILPESDFLFSGHPLGDARDGGSPQIFWDGEDALYLPWSERGHYAFARFDLANDTSEVVANIPGELYFTAHHTGRFYGWMCTPESPTEVVQMEAGKLKMLAPLNRTWLKNFDVALPEEISVPVPGSYDLHGWRIRGRGKKKKRPAVISVHGGPACFYAPTFFFEMQMFAAHGFDVFLSNPRGSTSYGEAHARSILGEWGQQDWADIQALTAFAKADPAVLADEVSIVGGSYGGYMVNWAIGHDTTYHRAVSDRCVSNLLSKWGNSDYPFVPDGVWPGCAFTNDIDVLWESSPIKHFKDVKTPTLVIHSVGDLRCHIEQGEQVFTALKMLGVRTRMVRYPVTTSHGLSRNGPPDLRIHRLQEYVNWLQS